MLACLERRHIGRYIRCVNGLIIKGGNVWKIKVLLADDQADMRQIIKAIVENSGADVVAEAENGEEAIQKYIEHKPHLTLLDINMPVIDGAAALRAIREVNPQACVIMLTADNKTEMVRQCVALGARAYVLKNNTPDAIASEILAGWDGYLNKACGLK